MAKSKMEDIRNLVFAGHGGTGKTTLVDEILYATKANNRIGCVKEGTSLSDTASDEIEGKASIDLSLLYCNYNKKLLHILDTPGRSDFIGQVFCAFRAVETVLITVDGSSGIQVNTRKFWKMAKEQNKSVAFVLTKLDLENVNLEKVITSLQETFGSSCVPFFLPDTTGQSISKMISVLSPPKDASDLVKKFTEPLIEAIVESDEELMIRYLDGEDISFELEKQACKAISNGNLVPILGFGQKNSVGVKEILDTVTTYFPSPEIVKDLEICKIKEQKNENGEIEKVEFLEKKELPSENFIGQVFKTIVDEHKGAMALIRVFSGDAKTGDHLKNISTGKDFKLGKIFKFFGSKHEEVESVSAGEIFGATKIHNLNISHTISCGDWEKICPLNFPSPMVSLAIEPKSRFDEAHISDVLHHYALEDPTFYSEVDRQTKELVIHGMSELHLNVLLHRMLTRNKINVNKHLPKITYRETVTKEADAFYQHKKQSGGAGEYAKVHMRLRPYKGKDKNLNFINALKGDNVKRQFVPSVEKGCVAIMAEGILTGSPVIWVEVEFYDGTDHPVDSKDVAFQKAGKECFRKCFMDASPALLEPMVHVELSTPAKFAGEITQYINSHRGRILSMEMLGNEEVTKCNIPLAEVQNLASDLRSLTHDQGSYTMEFSSYEQVPSHVQKQVIEKFQKDKEEDHHH